MPSDVVVESSIEIDHITHFYKKNQNILEDVNLSLGTGLFGLLGANGAGKSTLMRIICTLLVPKEGSARVCGYDVVKDCRQVRELIGYLPQEFSAWRLHRVEEVLDTLAQISGMTNKKIRRARVAEVLESVGLDAVADRKVKKLSGGMVRRLGVAQALVHEPQVLIVDEPTVGLDPEERMRFRQLMTQLGRDRTILLSTHIVADLGSGVSQIAILDDGNISFQGEPTELLNRAQDFVYRIPSSEEGLLSDELDFEIVSREGFDQDATVRVVVDDPDAVPSSAEKVNDPSLEEAYLAFMAARGKLSTARQIEEELDAKAKKKQERMKLKKLR
ncbi:MAG: ATP-binding cassette domain-containing protein [Gammaproteobacteria bacterium]|nr:ATP-binding cassette domain-containing protein [Gammaproteobacteria bacterium]